MVSASPSQRADVVLVGGGLANGLIALRLKSLRPRLRVILLEQGPTIGGEHTWCHFATDVDAVEAGWLRPLIVHRWSGYEVRFPGHGRQLPTDYLAITSSACTRWSAPTLGADAWLSATVSDVNPHQVTLADGRTIAAGAVIDGRGPRKSRSLALGYQKFVGQGVRLTAPHGLTRPIIMDATVSQEDGYRFVYVLPLDATRLLIEDTRYSDGPALDRPPARRDRRLRQGPGLDHRQGRARGGRRPAHRPGRRHRRLLARGPAAHRRGRPARRPVPADHRLFPARRRAPGRVGRRPAPHHQRQRPRLRRGPVQDRLAAAAFLRLLNRMLFRACAPGDRYKVLERFYRLSPGLIQRFYAARLTKWDKARLLIGKPPVPISAAIKCIGESSVFGGQDA
jgi:lycopene beta-cyclase